MRFDTPTALADSSTDRPAAMDAQNCFATVGENLLRVFLAGFRVLREPPLGCLFAMFSASPASCEIAVCGVSRTRSEAYRRGEDG